MGDRRSGRDPDQEARERLRFQVLEWLYKQVGRDCKRVVSAGRLSNLLRVRPEEIFAAAEYLSRHGYIRYVGAGPRVCITDAGFEYIAQARRRRSVRDAQKPR